MENLKPYYNKLENDEKTIRYVVNRLRCTREWKEYKNYLNEHLIYLGRGLNEPSMCFNINLYDYIDILIRKYKPLTIFDISHKFLKLLYQFDIEFCLIENELAAIDIDNNIPILDLYDKYSDSYNTIGKGKAKEFLIENKNYLTEEQLSKYDKIINS